MNIQQKLESLKVEWRAVRSEGKSELYPLSAHDACHIRRDIAKEILKIKKIIRH